jgi:hypothetical protein
VRAALGRVRVGQLSESSELPHGVTELRVSPAPMLMKKENWPELVALTSFFSVELAGIEPGI